MKSWIAIYINSGFAEKCSPVWAATLSKVDRVLRIALENETGGIEKGELAQNDEFAHYYNGT